MAKTTVKKIYHSSHLNLSSKVKLLFMVFYAHSLHAFVCRFQQAVTRSLAKTRCHPQIAKSGPKVLFRRLKTEHAKGMMII